MFSSGGGRGLSFVSAIERFCASGLKLTNIKTVIGTSVGSMIALGAVISDTAKELRDLIDNVDLAKLQDPVWPPWRIFQTWSMFEGKGLPNELNRVLKERTGLDDPDFATLYKHTGRDLKVVVSSITTMQPIMCSKDTTPKLSVIKAIGASISVPGVFPIRDIAGHQCIDGFLVDSYAIARLTREQRSRTIGFLILDSATDMTLFGVMVHVVRYFREFIRAIIGFVFLRQLNSLKFSHWLRTAVINVGHYRHLDFNPDKNGWGFLNRAGRLSLYAFAYNKFAHAARNSLKSFPLPFLPRYLHDPKDEPKLAGQAGRTSPGSLYARAEKVFKRRTG